MKVQRRSWTAQEIKSEAAKYSSRMEFEKKNRSAYRAACKRGKEFTNEVCEHMTPMRKIYSEISLVDIAAKFSSRWEFGQAEPNAYRAATSRGAEFMNRICAHMDVLLKTWSNEEVAAEALKFSTRNAFAKHSNSAYQIAGRRGILDDVCTHMDAVLNSWTKEAALAEASKYTSKEAFYQGCSGAYGHAYRNGFLGEICSHMEPLRKDWTKNEIADVAKTFSTRGEFALGYGSAYEAARSRNILDDVCAHMTSRYVERSDDNLAKVSASYNDLKKFRVEQASAYKAIQTQGRLIEFCGHMERGTSGFDYASPGYLYYLRVQPDSGPPLYKIGITNNSVSDRFSNADMELITVLSQIYFDLGYDALDAEQHVLREFSGLKYQGAPILSSGNTELFEVDVLCLDHERVGASLA